MKAYSLRLNIGGKLEIVKLTRSKIIELLEKGEPDYITTKPIENMPVDLHNKIADYNSEKIKK